MLATAVETLVTALASEAKALSSALVADEPGAGSRLSAAVASAAIDARAHLRRDPSLHGSVSGLLSPGSSFLAVAAKRLAHRLWIARPIATETIDDLRAAALAVAFRARRETGVDIHPGASLGLGFVVDHGYGTVIGETVEAGDDCYILNAVTLGARGIADNPLGRRHPRLGHRVEIGAFSCVLGPVEIGDDVFIGPHCMVCEDVPARTRIRLSRPHEAVPSGTASAGVDDRSVPIVKRTLYDARAEGGASS